MRIVEHAKRCGKSVLWAMALTKARLVITIAMYIYLLGFIKIVSSRALHEYKKKHLEIK